MIPVSASEAKQLVCPFMSGPTTYSDAPCIEHQLCLTSGCMAWQWTDKNRKTHVCDNPTAYLEPPRPALLPKLWTFVPYRPEDGDDPACWIESEAEFLHRRRGKCLRLTPPPSDTI